MRHKNMTALERFSEEISEMAGETLASGEAESLGNIRSDFVRARQRSPAAKDPCPFRNFVLRTALTGRAFFYSAPHFLQENAAGLFRRHARRIDHLRAQRNH